MLQTTATNDMVTGGIADLFPEELFNALYRHECKRSERSRTPFLLMLIDVSHLITYIPSRYLIPLVKQLLDTTRSNDYKGWHKDGNIIGILFTECNAIDIDQLRIRIIDGLRKVIGHGPTGMLQFSLYQITGTKKETLFCDSTFTVKNEKPDDGQLYPSSLRKRFVDIAGAIFGLLIFFPMFISIALMIKLTSRGPVFFRQERVGQNGKSFHMLKFRSMYLNNDDSLHREFVAKLIKGQTESDSAESENQFFKIQNDPRVTPVGRLIRKTSMDELPQFLNVLKGEMSLVGPRPALPYEVAQYDIWHCRRVLARPGITGLWQTTGRSLTTFNSMVRMDIHYMEKWSLATDLLLILRTPFALISTKGAC